ncbi:MAG: RNA-directed DNA polymerase, partial [Bacteroidales bacterium]
MKELKILRTQKRSINRLYITKSIKNAINEKRQIDNRVSKGLASLAHLNDARRTVKTAITAAKKKSYNRYIKKGIEFLRINDAKNSWRWLKSHSRISKKNLVETAVYKHGSKNVETEPQKVLEIWTEHFRNLGEACQNDHEITNQTYSNKYCHITDQPITWTEVVSTLKSLRNGKATGKDGIPGEVYKLIRDESLAESNLAKAVLQIMNEVFTADAFPNEWNDSIVVPIFKKGDRFDPNNYRGISLICTLLKILAKILAARLQVVCNEMNLLRREQSGFLTSEECVAQTACLIECCQRRKLRGEKTILCFLDMKKAYDMVPHRRLISTLRSVGLGKVFTDFIQRMYENTTLRIRIGNQTGESFQYKRGVRQGCPTSPLLFNIYYDSILKEMDPVPVEGINGGLKGLMFADDTVIVGRTRSELVNKLAIIENWLSINAMELNPSKCGIMEIDTDPYFPQMEPILYNGELIPSIDKYVYLGTEINKSLDLTEMAKYRLNKGRQTLIQLRTTLINERIPIEYRIMLIKSILIPRCMFGAEIFGMSEKRVDPIKRILDNALKCILKRSNFCRLRAYQEFDIEPLYVQAASYRTRGVFKWRESRSLISDLIQSYEQFVSRKRTWIKEANRWLRTMKISPDLTTEQAVQAVKQSRHQHLLDRDKSVIGTLAGQLAIKSGKHIRRYELSEQHNPVGINALIRLRTGTFTFTNGLIRSRGLSPIYKDRCVACNANVKEDIWH